MPEPTTNPDAWVVQDEPSRRFPIYSRGNVGEVFPEVVSPLTWTVFGPEVERGWRDAFARFGVLRPGDFGDAPFGIVGCFGGYAYLNASFLRVFAVRTPGLRVRDLDVSFFGTDDDVPPYRTAPGDRDLRASLRMVGTLRATLRPASLEVLDDDRRLAESWAASLPEPATASDATLVAVYEDFRPVFRRLFAHHIDMTFRAQIGPGLLEALVTKVLRRPAVPPAVLAGLGDVDSTGPTVALWDLGRKVASTPAVTACFDAGLDGLEARLRADAGAAAFVAAFDAFLAEHGFRGPNEWDAVSPTWGTDPALALAALDRLRLAPASHDPHAHARRLATERLAATAELRAALPAPLRRVFDSALASAQRYAQGRERSKTTVMRAIHRIRLVQRELARRGRDRGGPADLADFWLLTGDEVRSYLADPPAFTATLGARHAQRDALAARVPPFVFTGRQPLPSTWPLRAAEAPAAATGSTLVGIAGSPGVARGRARVVLDAADPTALEPGDVLVAPLTDPSWTPLFLAADAVVVDVGAVMSHAVIVARELGIPAVVSVADATRTIPDGTLVEVDGDTGEVRLLPG